MTAKNTLAASAALAAFAMVLWSRHCQGKRQREAEFEQKYNEEALAAFEGEGGLVVV